jgi:hypothetical protein
MIRFAIAAALLGTALLAVAPAQGAGADVNAAGVITGSGKTWSITIQNTGSEPIRCFKFFLDPTVLVTKPGPAPAGWQVGTQGQVLFGQSADGIMIDGKQAFTFSTTVAYPPEAGGKLNVSADCQTDAQGIVTGPTRPPATKKPCACKSLSWAVGRVAGSFYLTLEKERSQRGMTLRLGSKWVMRCTKGNGGCKGALTVTIPPAQQRSLGLRFGNIGPEAFHGRTTAVVICKSKTCEAASDSYAFQLVGGPKLGFGKRGVDTRSVTLVVSAACGRTRERKQLTIVFGEDSGVDRERSDFNGNDVPDGAEKR